MQTTIKIQTVDRDRLFFEQYRYSICFQMQESTCLRAKTVEELQKNIQWRNISRKQWASPKELISQEIESNLMHMWNVLQSYKGKIRYTMSFNTMYVYGNAMASLENIARQTYTRINYAQECQVTKPRDVVVKKDPKFAFRSYFRDKSLERHDHERLRVFLESRSDTYGITKGFRLYLAREKWFFLMRHQYIEHNDPKDLTMLSLVLPGLIRKTVPVQAK